MSMLSPGGVGRSSASRQVRRPRWWVKALSVLAALAALALVAAGAWFYLLHDETAEPSARTCTRPRASTAGSLPRPRQVHVNVYNSTNRAGLAARAAETLDSRGFKIDRIDNDPLERDVAGTAELRHGRKGKAPAQLLAAHVPNAAFRVDKRPGTTVDVVLGRKFNGLNTTAQARALLKPGHPRPRRTVGC